MDSQALVADAIPSPRRNGYATTTAKSGGNGKASSSEECAPLLPPDSPLLKGLSVTLQARLGEAVLPVAELLALRSGSVLHLETRLNEPVELYLNDALVGRGEIVAVDDRFGVRLIEIAAT